MFGNERSYDAVIIGGGPAGIIGAVAAANRGRRVAVVDSHAELGGAGVNTGTVPSKTLRETALALSGMRSRKLYGVDLSLRRDATVSDFLRHQLNVKAGLNAMLSERLEASGADVYRGTGYFADAHTIRVRPAAGNDEVSLAGEKILIATGSAPVRPALFHFGSPGVYDSDSILQLDEVPRSLAVIGAGVIGSEYACTFAALGTRVNLIDGRGILLPFLDGEVSRALTAAMQCTGITFHWNERVVSCVIEDGDRITLTLSSGESLTVDAVLVAAGRRSNTEALNLAAAGLTASERGLIRVDEHFLTDVPHIYAAGDVVGFPALASTSMQQGRHAMMHAFGADVSSAAFRLLPTGVYTIPEVGMVGDTEESLKQKGIDYVVGLGPYQANARGRIVGDDSGFLKLLFHKDDMKLLGVHAMGERATELVHIGLLAMLTDSTADLFSDMCFNMPTLGELYKLASLDAISRVTTGRSLVDLPSLDLSAHGLDAATPVAQ
ncbi:MAG: Si-specific NAD(P)(+) transhydrogenase [Acidobacteriaceae bacterium]|nr:Si-specific NAD(P)(+) transhydrogenase [Acidobacteriaceae bacterium]